jgi:membrane carboxypeptidase/penicillin-binding protein PbpC
LHWYMNGRYLGPSSPESPRLLPIEHGAHTLTCMTADGATDTVAFEVAAPGGPLVFRPGA